MIILDTDHVTVLRYPEHTRFDDLQNRIADANGQSFSVTIVSVEEQMRGWLAFIHHQKDVHRQIVAYQKLEGLFSFFTRWTILSFDLAAADEFKRLRKQGIRVGTMDLKIAAVAKVHDALLLSANLSDFRQVPGLRVENWLGG